MTTFLIRNSACDQPWTCEAAKEAVRPVVDWSEHRELLAAKTLEEAAEFFNAYSHEERIKEAADVVETLISTIYISSRNEDYTREEIEGLIIGQLHRKRAVLGDFTDGLVLEIKRAKDA